MVTGSEAFVSASGWKVSQQRHFASIFLFMVRVLFLIVACLNHGEGSDRYT